MSYAQEPSENPNNIYERVKVKTDLIDRFDAFLKKAYPDNYNYYYVNFSTLNNSDIVELRKLWEQYLYGDFVKHDSVEQAERTRFLADSLLMAQSRDSALNQLRNQHINQNDSNVQVSVTVTVTRNKPKFPSKTKKNEVEDYSRKTINETALQDFSILQYRVQVAANRIPLSDEEIDRIYVGTVNINESFEDSWYKYITDTFSNYQEAAAFRSNCDVKGAFVVYYFQGKRTYNPGKIKNENIKSFKIQIAAAKKPINDLELKSIYSGIDQVQEHFDGIWYHYVIDCGFDIDNAKIKLSEIGVNGAFLAIYIGKERIYPAIPGSNINMLNTLNK